MAVLTSVAPPRPPVMRRLRVDDAQRDCQQASPREAGALPATCGLRAQPLKAPHAFCRVAATLTPSSDSDIKVEIWMPAANWNGKFQAVGNGAFNGTIAYPAMMTALGRGYATASTDTGHVGGGASFAVGHPEKVIDFGWRAVHEMAVISKQIIAAYYAAGPRVSYWNGCSAGGRQAMKEAQRFPADFDGIIAGAPGLDWTGRAAQAVYVAQALENNEAARLSPQKAQLVHAAVLRACDLHDGVKDGIVGDPERCEFDPGVLQCQGADETSCLTAAQVQPPGCSTRASASQSETRSGGLQPGSELGWTDWDGPRRHAPPGSISSGSSCSRTRAGTSRNSTSTRHRPCGQGGQRDDQCAGSNLGAFISRAAGASVSRLERSADLPANSVHYYKRVLEALGGAGKVQGAYRLFMAPGMAHAAGARVRTRSTWSPSWSDGGAGPGARSHHRVAFDQRRCRSHAAALSVPAGRDLQGTRKHG